MKNGERKNDGWKKNRMKKGIKKENEVETTKGKY